MDAVRKGDERMWPIPDRLRLELLAYLSRDGVSTGTNTMTYQEFLDWCDEDTLAEWVDGRVVMTSPASLPHQRLGDFLGVTLAGFVRILDLGEVIRAPFQMKLAHSGREPDLLFVATAHLPRLHRTYLEGPADLVVEILSPESIGRDRGDKFFEYQEAGVPEYWLIDPATARAEFYQLDPHGNYLVVEPGTSGIYRSALVRDFWLDVAWLWQEPLPRSEDVLLEIAGDAYAHQLVESLQRRGYLPTDRRQ